MTLRRWSGPLLVAAILAAVWIILALVQPPGPPRDEPPPTSFSADRAWRHIEEIGRAPHPVGTPAHDRLRAYLVSELGALGLEVDTLTAVSTVRWGGVVRSALTRNLVARLPGTASTGAVLLVSHYDGVPRSPAAADGGIGVATVLETARALRSGEPLRNDVIVLITDAEELGLLGARAFAAEHPWMDDVAFVANFEARGTTGAAVMFETGPGSGWAVRELARIGRRPVTSSVFPVAWARMPNDTDFSVYRDLGLPGLNFAIGGSAQWYHSPGDSPENLSRASLQHMGDNALAVARRMGAMDLGDVAAPPDPVYFHVPGLGIFGYGPGWAPPLAALLVAAFGVVVGRSVRRRRLRWWALPVGLVAAGVALAAAALLGQWLWSAVRDAHPEWGALHGRALHREAPYALALVAMSVALVAGIFTLLRRWIGLDGLALGALVLPVAGAVVTAFTLPAASYMLLWPALAALAMVALGASGSVGGRPRQDHPAGDHAARDDTTPVARSARAAARTPSARATIGIVLAALVVLLFMAPAVYLVYVMVGVAAAPILALAAGILAVLLLPLLDRLAAPHPAWLPATAAFAAVGLVGLGLAGAAPSADRPAPSHLVHLQDAASGQAWWASPVGHDDAFTAHFVGDGADTLALADYSALLRGGAYRVATAPAWDAGSTRFRVLEDATDGDVRRLRLRLSWDQPPMMAEIRPAGEDVRLLEPRPGTLAGEGDGVGEAVEAGETGETGGVGAADETVEVDPPVGRWRLELWGLRRPFDLTLELPAGEPLGLVFSSHYPGLPRLGDPAPARPPDRMALPAHRWFTSASDTRVVRATLEIP